MLTEPLVRERVLGVRDGMGWTARQLTGESVDSEAFAIFDEQGSQIGQVEHTERDSGGARVRRTVLALLGWGHGRREHHALRVSDAAGRTLGRLQIESLTLTVSDARGEWIGAVVNTSTPAQHKLEFHTAPQRKSGIFLQWGDPVASAVGGGDRPPFELEVRLADGASVARVTNGGDRMNVLEFTGDPDARLRTLIVGFACGLVDRVWIMKPKSSAPST